MGFPHFINFLSFSFISEKIIVYLRMPFFCVPLRAYGYYMITCAPCKFHSPAKPKTKRQKTLGIINFIVHNCVSLFYGQPIFSKMK